MKQLMKQTLKRFGLVMVCLALVAAMCSTCLPPAPDGAPKEFSKPVQIAGKESVGRRAMEVARILRPGMRTPRIAFTADGFKV